MTLIFGHRGLPRIRVDIGPPRIRVHTGAPRIYGHRGARGEMAENTIAGFRHAQAAGVDGIETDIALTADGVPVLHHDPELPDGRRIRDLAAAEIPMVPTLAAALAAVPGATWLLEIKTFPPTPDRARGPADMVDAVVAVIDRSPVRSRNIAVLAFDFAVLACVRNRAPALRRVALTAAAQAADPRTWWGEGYTGLTAPQAAERIGADIWSPHYRDLTTASIAEARALGLGVTAWTVNRPEDIARLAPLVDGLTTDYPTRFAAKRMTPLV